MNRLLRHRLPPGARTALRWAAATLAIQILTGLILWVILPHLLPGDVGGRQGSETRVIPGSAFAAVVAGKSSQQGDSRVILAMQPALRNGVQVGEAVFRIEPDLAAAAFSQLQLSLQGWQPGQRVFLFWRSSRAPNQQLAREILHDPAGTSWHTLRTSEGWEDTLLELAIGVFGAPGSDPLRLHAVTLHSTNRPSILQRLRWDWRQFQPWSHGSLNTAGSSRPDILIKATTAASLWALCSLLLIALGVVALRRRMETPPGAVAIAGLTAVLLPWLALDGMWQAQLERQLHATKARYSGLTQHEKHQREMDAGLQAYAAQIRDILAPMRGKRLFLLNDDDQGHAYQRLRLQFHLLPLNVYNFGRRLLPPHAMRPGDHVLLLAPATAVSYRRDSGLLQDGQYQYRATLLDDHAAGQLLRIDGPTLSAEMH